MMPLYHLALAIQENHTLNFTKVTATLMLKMASSFYSEILIQFYHTLHSKHQSLSVE